MRPSFARLALFSSAALGFLGVLLGAFGAHALHERLAENQTLDVWRTASLYQFVHALAILAISRTQTPRGPVLCWIVGVVLFSGSLYLLALDPAQKWAGPVTPLGGFILMAGWAWLGVAAWKKTA